MPIGDPRDGFFYPTLTLMMDCFNNTLANLSTNYLVMFDVHTYDDNDGINNYHTGQCKRTVVATTSWWLHFSAKVVA